jgi:hypothetical protein
MGQIIAIIVGLLALLGLVSFWVLKIAKGAKLEVISEVNEDIVETQHEQLKAGNDKPMSLDELGSRIDKGEPI